MVDPAPGKGVTDAIYAADPTIDRYLIADFVM